MNEGLKIPSLLERRWASYKQISLIAIFQKIDLSELHEPSKYLSPKINYADFMKYLRSTGSAEPKMGSLLEVAEQTIERVQHILLNARELWSEMPEELKNISLDAELLKQFEAQLDALSGTSGEFITKLQAFIDGHYLEASILFPMYQNLCKLSESYLASVNLFINVSLLNIISINPKIKEEDAYKNLWKCLDNAHEKHEQEENVTVPDCVKGVSVIPRSPKGSRAAVLASEDEKPTLLFQPSKRLPQELSQTNVTFSTEPAIIARVLYFVDLEELFMYQRVSKKWKASSIFTINFLLMFYGCSENEIQRFHLLPSVLQYMILKHLDGIEEKEKIHDVLSALDLSKEKRSSDLGKLPHRNDFLVSSLITDAAVVVRKLGLLVYNETIRYPLEFYSSYGALILLQGFIKKSEIETLFYSSRNQSQQLQSILSKNGFIVLRKGLLSISQAVGISELSRLLTDNGRVALEEGLITATQAQEYCSSGIVGRAPYANLSDLLSDNGLTVLRRKQVSAETAHLIPNLKALLSETGMAALNEGLITAQQTIDFFQGESGTSNLECLLTPKGLQLLREGLVTIEDVGRVRGIETIFSEEGEAALREGLFTCKQLATVSATSRHAIAHLDLLSEETKVVLRKKYVTPEQAAFFIPPAKSFFLFDTGLISLEAIPASVFQRWNSSELNDLFLRLCFPIGKQMLEEKLIDISSLLEHRSLKAIISLNGQKALKQKLLTLEQAIKIADLKNLLSEYGIKALEIGLITPEEAMLYSSLDIFGYHNSIEALQLGLITIKQSNQVRGYLNDLMSDAGISALKLKIIIIDEIIYKEVDLSILQLPNGVTALQENLITLSEAMEFTYSHGGLHILLGENGMQALREGLITASDVLPFFNSECTSPGYHGLAGLLSPLGLNALRKNLITPKLALGVHLNLMFSPESSPDILEALELKLISLSDFGEAGKFSCMRVKQVNEAVSALVPPKRETLNGDNRAQVVIPSSYFMPRDVNASSSPRLLSPTTIQCDSTNERSREASVGEVRNEVKGKSHFQSVEWTSEKYTETVSLLDTSKGFEDLQKILGECIDVEGKIKLLDKLLEVYITKICTKKEKSFFAALCLLSFLRKPTEEGLAALKKFELVFSEYENSILGRLYKLCEPYVNSLLSNKSHVVTLGM